mgnify:CR=1 FL=1
MQRNKNAIQNPTYRLNKYISLCNAAPSRRAADKLIEAGKISIDGKVVSDFSFQVLPGTHIVTYEGKKLIPPTNNYYVLLNKPKDTITTRNDELDRKTILDVLDYPFKEQLKPVGRLDRNTTGLLVLTNDGDLIQSLTHPSNEVVKIYQATLDKRITKNDLNLLLEGKELDDGFFQPDEISLLEDPKQVGIQIHSGKNRIVRRYFESFGYQVNYLDRVYFAGLTKYKLPRGKSRILEEKEVRLLLKNVKKKRQN